MSFLNELNTGVDLATRQRVFFYDLAKMGVIKFDLHNEEQIILLTQMVEAVNKYDEEALKDELESVRLKKKVNHDLDVQIIRQILLHTENGKIYF
jgi:hypothetical protein